MPVWMQEESGVVGGDGVARTTSLPYAGVLQSGTWMVGTAASEAMGTVTGSVSTFFPSAGSALPHVSLIVSLASRTLIFNRPEPCRCHV
nr:hypothetical protein [Nitrospirota bacterium]